jgi:predicted DNA-binding transcriptional regulator AlpA
LIAPMDRLDGPRTEQDKSGALKAAVVRPTLKALDPLLSLAQARELAGVSRWTVWSWITKEGLRTIEIHGVVRIRHSDWLAFLEAHTVRRAPALRDGTESQDLTEEAGQR